ncbi:MAG: glycosyltransferase [Candidatus Marinimicrobia bacterium]|jgi:colanic acid/amylovoran biosynthesis glycosyltransferase|nr:glycosyltransferase [Candidatus Neomarinimicrobiota bacterium]MBT4713669.1 glycosyltransferase [Candidatus Neomarinimicrobiota bacterium]
MKIILITSTFPFKPAEEFLETEILFWAERSDISVSIVPLSFGNDRMRSIPENINLDLSITRKFMSELHKALFYGLQVFFVKYFYIELLSEVKSNWKKISPLFSSIISYLISYHSFKKFLKRQPKLNETVFYTYWNNEATFALQSLKKRYGYQIFSRIHGHDLYKNRRTAGYMPLKKHFTKNIDGVFTVTDNAREYLTSNYGFEGKVLKLGRLGVIDRKIKTGPASQNSLHIVSCSHLSEVKQIHKVIEALCKLALSNTHIEYRWTHLGGGLLYERIQRLASESLASIKNVNYKILGVVENERVFRFYKEEQIDLFINVSMSEGAPVTIMEALSCHIPIVAPDIGGIGEMVINNHNGRLLNSDCSIESIIEALSDIELFKREETRMNSHAIYLNKYDARRNYVDFINFIADKSRIEVQA